MKKKYTISILLMVLMLATTILSASSMQYGNIDAYWGYVDQGPADPNNQYQDGATCMRYADGPVGTEPDPDNIDLFNTPLSFTDPQIQNNGGNTTNWNQVRYGIPGIHLICLQETSQTQFKLQSGLAFNGVNERNPKPNVGAMTPFSLGKLCHINKVIHIDNTGGSPFNSFNMTTAHLNIKNVDCGPGGTLVKDKDGTPYDPSVTSLDLTYSVPVQFDETPNEGTCTYPSVRKCADAIIPGQAQGQHFYCKITAQDGSFNVLDYTVAFLGFTQVPLNGSCENAEYNPALSMPGIFISDERATNCACAWAAITETVPSAVEMNFFEAEGGFESIILRWQTAFETDNIGFNIFRAESLDRRQAVQLNTDMISSLVPPGSTFGADYEFIDNTAKPYRTYFYWIEDLDVNGEVTSHGPSRAEWVD